MCAYNNPNDVKKHSGYYRIFKQGAEYIFSKGENMDIEDLLKNTPTYLLVIASIYFLVLSLVWIALPFIMASMNKKMKVLNNNLKTIHDEMLEIEDLLVQLRKETNVRKYLEKDQ